MPTPTFQPPQGQQSTAQLQDWIVKLVRDLNYLLENLDTVNINRLDARVIIAGSILADKINVTELSAISANMGTITAGSITTSAEINVGTDVTVGDNLYVGQATTNDKVIHLNGAFIKSIFGADSIGIFGAGVVTLTSLDTIVLACSLGNVGVLSQHGSVTDIVDSINTLTSSISSLTTALTGKANSGSSTNSISVADNHNHGLSNSDYIQCYDAVGTPTLKKQWVAYTGSVGHSHTI